MTPSGGRPTKGKAGARTPRASSTLAPRKPGTRVKASASADKPVHDASRLIDERIRDLGGWRGETLARMRALILGADAGMIEEWKWGTPVWSRGGILCTGESYKSVVKLTFAKGASLQDPARLFNSSLEGNVRRAIDLREGEVIDAPAFKALLRQAAALNGAGAAKPAKKAAKKAAKKTVKKPVKKTAKARQ